MSSSFIKETIFRICAIVVVKAIGLIGRVSLTRLIGAEGIGLFQIAYSYYGLGLMLLTGGLPTALALFTAKHPPHGWVWFKIFTVYLIIIGGCATAVTFYYSEAIARFLGNEQLRYFIHFLAPAFFTVPMLTLLRGYLQGIELYNVIAVSEIVEQAVRVTFMLVIVTLFLPIGPAIAAGNSMVSTTFGAISAFLLLISYYLYVNRRSDKSSIRNININYQKELRWFLRSSFLISITRLLIPLSDVLDAIIIPSRLQVAGYSSSEATAMFGVLTGMAALVAYMPTLVTAALSHTLTMRMVSDWQARNYERFHLRTRVALKISWVWGWIASLFLYVYNAEISLILFGTMEAAKPIQFLFIIPLLVGIREMSTSILWVQESKRVPFIGLLTGISVSLIAHYYLVAIPGLNYRGASIAILILEIIAVGCNLLIMFPSMKKINYSRLMIDALVIISLMMVVNHFTHQPESGMLQTIIGMIVYVGCSLIYTALRFKSAR
ncbi:oligosaccharide flippase family protein [Paenibacillus solani]|uniref:oligosaccharide flippase family protein n=1 Tax=Paenibacillus solani TaxID=1705565 RepID=UPI003D2C0F53